jgi:GntR family transcriptional regulator
MQTDGETDRLVHYLRDHGRLGSAEPAALYRRLGDALKAAIDQHVVKPGSVIPGERELAQRLGLSRVTVRKAVKELVDERLLVQRHGARTSVAGRVEKPASVFTSFSQDMHARGMKPGGIWLSREIGTALPTEALALGLSPGAPVCRLRRLRTADDTPMAIENAVIPTEFLPTPALVVDSLYHAIEARGHSPARALQRMRAVVANLEEAALLGVPRGAPLLETERRCFLETGQPFEFSLSRYRGDAYDFLVELQTLSPV